VPRRDWLEQLEGVTARLLDELRGEDASALRRLRADIEELHARVESELAWECRDHPRLLVLLCGTTLMHSGAVGHTPDERVTQARAGTEPSLTDYAAYVPTEGATEKLLCWSDQGAEISYLSFHRDSASVAACADVVRASGFPPGAVLARTAGESYEDVVQRAAPDVLIEDDRMSTGSLEIAYDQLGHELRDRVGSIIVPEFGGLAHLPANLNTLLAWTA
jgi:hypothetical protein